MNVALLDALRHRGVQAALLAALLFGAGTPLAKLLLDAEVSPWMLAGLLYLGSGLGLTIYRVIRRSPRVRLARADVAPLAGAILFGGLVGPVLLMYGLVGMPASGASLLLNAEGVFTALLAWFVFRENVSAHVALGVVAIVAGAVVLSWPGQTRFSAALPALAVLGACLSWAIDNNLTRMVSLVDASWLAGVKGLVAGPVNLVLAFSLGSSLPPASGLVAAMTVGLVAYGASLALFIVALRLVGTARAGAYFSVAPFFGAVLALALGEALTVPLVVAGLLMALGVGLHLSEQHSHEHTHEALAHDHWHTHDDLHHDHHHEGPVPRRGHRHPHTHEAITHTHEHYPDIHHRHTHDRSARRR
ncbi:Permease of the drug/metabolite transporter (DMT) superfamily [Raineyella antarctica]|uniref:Permease of the drug/metabolite transporter (DMT) superfamily n=1 Tax=Raineyella antarctica TaxID=1577474 RepID=A0A1G6ID13_9ACTN|nr:DMT family transporter [Raineyella antarctica]SDC04374.1 Permease of the drug/metabolite transporter (DMT) superfamily [Raineyella antarctica]